MSATSYDPAHQANSAEPNNLLESVARRFPLVPRSKPPCPPLTTRLEQIRARAYGGGQDDEQRPVRAAQALNLAALTASDCGLPDLARELCTRQAAILLTARPLDAAGAKLALQPLINLGRLRTREGDGHGAYQLFERLLTAAKTQSDVEIDGLAVPFTNLTASTNDHRETTQWLWSVLLADGTRALAQAGCWHRTLKHIHRHRALGTRLLDGRQIGIVAHTVTGDHKQARDLIASARPSSRWEETVVATLRVLCLTSAGRDAAPAADEMVERYLAADSAEREHAAFRSRLGLCVTDLATNARDRQQVTDLLIREALESEDAYAARDLLAHPCRQRIGHTDKQTFRALLSRAGLDAGSVPSALHEELTKSVQAAETTLRKAPMPTSATSWQLKVPVEPPQ